MNFLMLRFEKKLTSKKTPDTNLVLDKDQRERSRLKVTLEDGREAGLFFEKGTTFQDGDLIISDDGAVVAEIRAATETVSTVRCDDPLLLAKACYHLGNRHVPLQIESGRVRYQHDHVLDDMLRGLGLDVVCEEAFFQPEPGAYGGSSSHHSHSHGHTHSHSHSHD